MHAPAPGTLELVRIPTEEVAAAAARAMVPPQVLARLRPGQTAREFVEALVRESMYSEAISFLAFGLPRRESVWWGALFVLWTGAGRLLPEEARRLQAVARWVAEPDEAHRLAAAELEDPATPAGRLARAVKRTGGSMLPPSAPVRPPAAEMTPRAVVAAITAAILQGEAKGLPLRQRQAVALGMHIARGHYLWTNPTPAPTSRR
jgi:hypothetical protein